MNTRLTAALIAAAFAAIPVNAFAQDYGRILSDPNYLPLTGELDGTSAYTYGMTRGDTFDSADAKLNSFRVNANTLTQSFEYGLNNDFSIGASIAYDPMDHIKIEPVGGPSTSRDRSGFSDPTFNVNWRAMDGGPMIFDLFASYSPDFVKAQYATPTDDGTLGRGGQAASFGAGLGHEWPNFGLRATASADWLDNRNIDAPATASTQRLGSTWNYDLGLNAQARFTDRMSANFGGGYSIRRSLTDNDAVLGANWTIHPGDVANLHAALNYHFVPNRVVGSLTYQYNAYNSSTNSNATPATFDSRARNQNENIFGAKLAYVLN